MGNLASLDNACGQPSVPRQRMYQTNPSAAFKIYTNGANPLHIACLNGLSYGCLECIISQTKAVGSTIRGDDLATKLDHDKRCTLHHAVEFACMGRKPDDAHIRACLNAAYDEEQHQPSYLMSVIQGVIWGAPKMLNAQDNDTGDTPID